MISLLAQSTPPAGFSSFVENIAYIAVTISAVIVAWKQLTGKGNKTEISNKPVLVREDAGFATKPELNAVENRMNGEVHQLHGRISGVRSELNAKVDGIDKRIDEIPQRTIELLKTVKEYHKS